jgi:phage shock protein PspC (stress-responsive transcriptional regulator)
MNKVLTISLNGNAYQLEEAGYETLRTYLEHARAKLAGNPDETEIMADLEQAVADKLRRLMGSYKSVASGDDVTAVLKEMGPVESSTEEEAETSHEEAKNTSGTKRLYNIRDGAIIGGVCNGVAAYFNVDVTVVRLAFVILTLATSGVWILIYFIMMVFVPYADTPEKIARAEGAPWNAQDIMDHWKEGYDNLMKNADKWHTQHLQWKATRKHWEHDVRRYWKEQERKQRYASWHEHERYTYRRPSFFEEIGHLAFLGLIIWAAYTYVPQTHPFFDTLSHDIAYGWNWLLVKLNAL